MLTANMVSFVESKGGVKVFTEDESGYAGDVHVVMDEEKEQDSWLRRTIFFLAAISILFFGFFWADASIGASSMQYSLQQPYKPPYAFLSSALHSIIMVEGYRMSKQFEILQWPILWAITEYDLGPQILVPGYLLANLFVLYRYGHTNYSSSNRPIPSSVALALFPIVALFSLAPAVITYLQSAPGTPGENSSILLSFPPLLSTAVTTLIFSSPLEEPTQHERGDFLSLQVGFSFLFSVQAGMHVLQNYETISPLLSCTPGFFLEEVTRKISFSGMECAVIVWLAVAIFDLAYYSKRSRMGIITLLPGVVTLVGPGATMIGVWGWRETFVKAAKAPL